MNTGVRFVLALALIGCGTAANTGSTTPQDRDGDDSVTVETGSVAVALTGAHRSDANRARDRFRHPEETLSFFGLEPTMTVVEMAPGGGWYTEVLAPVLRDDGELVVAMAAAEDSRFSRRLLEKMGRSPEVYDRVRHQVFAVPEQPSLGEPGSADMVLTFRSNHNWIRGGDATAIYRAIFEVLRPGGVLGVVQHRADDGADPAETAPQGYVSEAAVIALAEEAGFVLEARSDVNANPNDDHDHPRGVWTLPPVLTLGDEDREQWTAIGESDRMTLRFRKPATEAQEAPSPSGDSAE